MEILVFKTNLTGPAHVDKLMPSLDNHPGIKEWNIDLHDCDNILRVITEKNPAAEVERLVLNAGYICEELK